MKTVSLFVALTAFLASASAFACRDCPNDHAAAGSHQHAHAHAAHSAGHSGRHAPRSHAS